MRKGADRWLDMSPAEQRTEAKERWQSLDPEQKARFKQRFFLADPQQRARLLERWDRATPEQRQRSVGPVGEANVPRNESKDADEGKHHLIESSH